MKNFKENLNEKLLKNFIENFLFIFPDFSLNFPITSALRIFSVLTHDKSPSRRLSKLIDNSPLNIYDYNFHLISMNFLLSRHFSHFLLYLIPFECDLRSSAFSLPILLIFFDYSSEMF